MTALAFWLLVSFLVFVYFEPSVLFPALSGLQLPLVLLSSALLLALAGGAARGQLAKWKDEELAPYRSPDFDAFYAQALAAPQPLKWNGRCR